MANYVNTKVIRWRTGTTEGQVAVLVAIAALLTVMAVVSYFNYTRMPISGFYVPLLLGILLLRFWPLMVLIVLTVIYGTITVIANAPVTDARWTSIILMTLSLALIIFQASRHRSGLPGPVTEAMLVDLRDRLEAQGKVPPLPPGWHAQSAMKSAGGVRFAGDFLVAMKAQDESRLEMVLVDVCGKGVAAGTQSLQLAGALGGLIGALGPDALFQAANGFLLRQNWEEGFATAVHVSVDLVSGDYTIINAGHPPALRWENAWTEWSVDGARGIALGIMEDPEFHMTKGQLLRGDALMFYTDGVVETAEMDVDTGIQGLIANATDVVAKTGFDGAARRLIARVKSGDDDRAVLVLYRD